MTAHRTARTALLTASLLGLAACGSDGSSDDPASPPSATGGGVQGPVAADDVPTDTDVAATPGSTREPVQSVGPATRPVDAGVDLDDPSPRIITDECGALPVADDPPSVFLGAPAALLEGLPTRARIGPDQPGNFVHYWRIELEAGYHHIVLETRRLDGRRGNMQLDVNDVDADGESNDLLVRTSDLEFRTRSVAFFATPVPRTVTLEVTPRYSGGEEYVLGVFANGRAIPSPHFEGCPEIRPLSLATTEAVRLAEANAPEDFVWYRAELGPGDYEFAGTASRADGRSDANIGFVATLFDEFAQRTAEERVATGEELGDASTTERATFSRSEAGPVWLRVEGRYADTDLQFSISPAGN